MQNIAHFVRKDTQLCASFIYNQISYHIEYKPYIIFRKNETKENTNDFSDFILAGDNYLDLSEDENWYEKMLFKTIKILSQRQLKKIEMFINNNKIDACHFHYGTDCGVYYPLLNYLKMPTLVSFYGYDSFSFPKKYCNYGTKYLKKRVFDKITKVLVMSPEMKKDLIKIGCPEEKIIIHYHGVPATLFSNINRNYNKQKQEITLFNLSYLDPVKGHIFILKSLRTLIFNGIINIKLRIAGSGFYEPVIKRFIADNHLNDFVTFLGPLKYGSKQMLFEFENADIFIHPSVLTKNDKEGIPGAIVEAMFASLPIITTYHGGIPYIVVNESTGILVNEWDVEALSNAIKRLAESTELRKVLGTAAKVYAINNLELREKEIELEYIYSSLI